MERRIPRPREIFEFGKRNGWKLGAGAGGAGGAAKIITDPKPEFILAAVAISFAVYQAYRSWNSHDSEENNDVKNIEPKS